MERYPNIQWQALSNAIVCASFREPMESHRICKQRYSRWGHEIWFEFIIGWVHGIYSEQNHGKNQMEIEGSSAEFQVRQPECNLDIADMSWIWIFLFDCTKNRESVSRQFTYLQTCFRSLTYNHHMSQDYAFDVLMTPIFWIVDNYVHLLGPVCFQYALSVFSWMKIMLEYFVSHSKL